MKRIIAVGVVFAAALSLAAEGEVPKKAKLTKAEAEAMHEQFVNEEYGGELVKPGTPKGAVFVVNAQKKVAVENFDITKTKTCRRLKGILKIVEGESATVATAAAVKERLGADFAIFVVDDASLPPSLVALECQWAILNVGALAKGAATEEIVRIRARNEFSRVFAMLCGGFSSQYKNPLANYVKDISDLDKMTAELPVDVFSRLPAYLEYRGVIPEKKVLYKNACKQGWAPKPTNDVQRAIWNEINAIPSSPIKIKKSK